jgi:Protein of unknown function (DUF3137)
MELQELENSRLWLVTIDRYNKYIRIALGIFWVWAWLILKVDLPMVIFLFCSCYGFTLAWFHVNYDFFRENFRATILKYLVAKETNAKYESKNCIGIDIFNQSRIFQTISTKENSVGTSTDYNFPNVSTLLGHAKCVEDLVPNHQLGISKKEYVEYTGEDLIIFSDYGNLKLSELDINKIDVVKDIEGKETELRVKYFQGIFGVATFPFTFDGTTIVQSRKSQFTIQTLGEVVRLESPRFMEIWSVSTDSQIGARLALGTDIMNNLLYLHDKVKKNISMSFISNQVFFAIEQTKFL